MKSRSSYTHKYVAKFKQWHWRYIFNISSLGRLSSFQWPDADGRNDLLERKYEKRSFSTLLLKPDSCNNNDYCMIGGGIYTDFSAAWVKCQMIWRMQKNNLMFIGPCIIVTAEELKTDLMPLVILFYFLCTQYISDINISTIRSLRVCCWITTLVFCSCFAVCWRFGAVVLSSIRASACNTGTTQTQPHQISNTRRNKNKRPTW